MEKKSNQFLGEECIGRLMRKYAEKYPDYGFEKHKGYGTKAHTEAILQYGTCPLHRPSFLKKLYAKNGK